MAKSSGSGMREMVNKVALKPIGMKNFVALEKTQYKQLVKYATSTAKMPTGNPAKGMGGGTGGRGSKSR